MSPRYHISPKGPQKLTDAEIGAHKDGRGLYYNYHKAVKPLYKKPLYRDPRTFVALLIIVLLAILVSEVALKEEQEKKPSATPQRTR